MFRILTFRNLRRAAQCIVSKQRSFHSEIRNYGAVVTVGLRASQYRFYGFRRGGHSVYNTEELFCRSCIARNLSVASARFVQAVSLALTRSPLVVPGIFAFTSGQLAWAQRVSPETEHYPSENALYMRAQDGHAFVTSFLYSAVEGVILLVRTFYLMILFSPSIMMAPFADCLGPQFRQWWLHVVLKTLEKAGPAFIKWGQWAATRPDLFPRDLCNKLSELHTKAPEHSFAYSKKTIEKAFGRKLSEIFDSFEESPVASGSIAQVHRASLRFRYPGQKVKPIVVAVKVRHPGVGESIRRDFVIINLAAKISTFIPAVKWLRLDESVQQFAVFMMPVYPLVHPAVLVESYEQGESVSHYVDELEGHTRIKTALAHIGTHALLKMLLVDNFIHADMHPGNILVRVAQSNSSKKRLFRSKPHVIFLDVGMTAELSKSDRVNLLEFFKAVARRDGRTAAERTLKLSKQQNCPDPKAFIEEVEEAFAFWGTPEGDLVHPAECMQQLLEKVRRHRVNIDGNVCTVMVTTLVLEGWQRKLDPGYNVMDTLQTLLLKADWAKSLSYTIDGLMAP
ncbi:hypothetical protein Patl1_10910 [Pistacia atlantica]|uniref:Uncharacterized protein n=1 Tax=Pistacia atlantica TaxID=434234 RepID=A0ACC1A5F1_9ROSI|nr:hypothetical protein Patl1_10910 [Pistacia atlantica]